LLSHLQVGPGHVVYVGDGSSDLHVMLQVNGNDGYKSTRGVGFQDVTQIAKRHCV